MGVWKGGGSQSESTSFWANSNFSKIVDQPTDGQKGLYIRWLRIKICSNHKILLDDNGTFSFLDIDFKKKMYWMSKQSQKSLQFYFFQKSNPKKSSKNRLFHIFLYIQNIDVVQLTFEGSRSDFTFPLRYQILRFIYSYNKKQSNPKVIFSNVNLFILETGCCALRGLI